MNKEQVGKHKHHDIYGALLGFYLEMQKRLYEKQGKGWTKWNYKSYLTPILRKRIKKNMDEGHWVDVANLAMFAWEIGLKKKKAIKTGWEWLEIMSAFEQSATKK